MFELPVDPIRKEAVCLRVLGPYGVNSADGLWWSRVCADRVPVRVMQEEHRFDEAKRNPRPSPIASKARERRKLRRGLEVGRGHRGEGRAQAGEVLPDMGVSQEEWRAVMHVQAQAPDLQ